MGLLIALVVGFMILQEDKPQTAGSVPAGSGGFGFNAGALSNQAVGGGIGQTSAGYGQAVNASAYNSTGYGGFNPTSSGPAAVPLTGGGTVPSNDATFNAQIDSIDAGANF